ncbi:LytTR family transcriptional regulator DNA-binding domain-containing protein [Ekhidna sp.]|uniref:LytTR family transcriptional regulator DNA-binding domain-containing protein n=1 Tax=Ekhidna sp. TaxID=2608089 RepID=UPI0032984994
MKKYQFSFLLVLANSAVICFLYFTIDSHRLKIFKEYLAKDVVIVKYEDLNGDGEEEEILVRDYNNIYSVFNIRSEKDHISDLKIEGKIKSSSAIYFHDMDNDGIKEIWSIMRYQDTIWLKYSDLYSVKESYPIIPVNNDYSLENYDYLIEIAGIFDKYVVFSINAGYPLEPRAIYSFNWSTKKFNRTEDEGSLVLNPYFFDLDKDGTPEIITRSFAPENIHYDVPFTDSSSWLRVFDLNLNHFFEPTEYSHSSSKITVLPIETDSSNYLAVSSRYGRNEEIDPSISLIDTNGKIIKEKEGQESSKLFQYGNKLFSYNETTKEIYELTANLERNKFMVKAEVPLNPSGSKNRIAASSDFLVASKREQLLSVIANDLRSETIYQIDYPIINHPIWSGSNIIVHTAEKIYFFNYKARDKSIKWLIILCFICVQLTIIHVLKKRAKLAGTKNKDFIILKSGKERVKLKFNEILYLKSAGIGPYTDLFLANQDKPLVITKTLGAVHVELPDQFIRISRSIVVREDLIKKVTRSDQLVVISIKGEEIHMKASRPRLDDLPF